MAERPRRADILFANAITASRIAGVGILYVLMRDGRFALALLCFVLFAMSDACDGWWARRYGAVTRFGEFFDRCADKIFLLSLLALAGYPEYRQYLYGLLPPEGILFALSLWALVRPGDLRVVLGANQYGKWKAACEAVLVGMFLFDRNMGGAAATPALPPLLFIALFVASIGLAILSIVGHLAIGRWRETVWGSRKMGVSSR